MCRTEANEIRPKLQEEEDSGGEVRVAADNLLRLKPCLYLDLLYKGLIKPL